jgi:phosphatidylserine decarboxylase
MTFHKEGIPSLVIALLFAALVNTVTLYFFNDYEIVKTIGFIISALVLIIIIQFFRSPKRNWIKRDGDIISPADGKVVVIEEVEETEFFNERRLQVSIFMSPVNVHINRYPISGILKYYKYHPGLFLVAWHPKSSTENERTTSVVEDSKGRIVLFRQIAGALARRIVFFDKEGQTVLQNEECGFIKFGSRVDLLLPLDVKLNVKLNEKVKGGITTIAKF